MLLRGNTTPTPRPVPPPPPPPPLLLLLLLLLLYFIRLHYCTSTAIEPLHLVSSPEPFGRCVAARHKRRGGRPTDERNCGVKALLFVPETWRCRDSSAIMWQYHPFPPFPLYILIYGVPVDVPCMHLFFKFLIGLGTLLFLWSITVVAREAEGVCFLFVSF